MKENIEEEKSIKYYQNKDISFSVGFDTKKILEALGITEEDSFENHQIRFKTLLNLIEKLQKENEDWEKAYQEGKDKQFELLRENQKLQKENEELKESLIINKNLYEELCNKNNNLKKENVTLKRINHITEDVTIKDITELMDKNYKEFIEQFIPKQKVKDKIEELKEEYKKELEKNSTRAFILKCQTTILEELLEEKGE